VLLYIIISIVTIIIVVVVAIITRRRQNIDAMTSLIHSTTLFAVVLLLLTTFLASTRVRSAEGWISQQQHRRCQQQQRRAASPASAAESRRRRFGASTTTTTTTTTTAITSTQLSSSGLTAANNNIVLQPSSEDSDAFDSFKIGNARVHRYSRETNDPDSETEYVMWYHGRTRDMDESDDVALPPLSTGRIGRAVSRNGLAWVKDTKGSVSEDKSDVSLGLNKESWWGFDTAHLGLGNVLLPMSTPAVMTEGGVYLMYYMGGSLEETKVADYTSSELPEAMKDATIQGMKMKIGVALSQDGTTWGRIEGDDPSGACMVPYDPSDPNQQATGISPGVEEELYCAWPEVAVNLGAKDNSQSFLMYYSTMTKADKQKCIALAESPDGFRWEKRGIVIKPDSDGPDANGCARCCVIQDATYDEDSSSWTQAESGWTMYYEGVSPKDGKHRIMAATSLDHRTWTKRGVVLDIGTEKGAWDVGGVGSPHVLRYVRILENCC